MDSDSPAAECMATEQRPLPGGRLFTFGFGRGTKAEFGFPWSRGAAARGRTAPVRGRRHHREPQGHGPEP